MCAYQLVLVWCSAVLAMALTPLLVKPHATVRRVTGVEPAKLGRRTMMAHLLLARIAPQPALSLLELTVACCVYVFRSCQFLGAGGARCSRSSDRVTSHCTCVSVCLVHVGLFPLSCIDLYNLPHTNLE